jgi:predicted secreted protein
MSLTSGLAVYFIIWWLTLFAVLPWGVKNAHEEGLEVEHGHEAGAPVKARILVKFAVTTVIASLVFAFVYWLITAGPVALDDIPFFPKFRSY